MSRDPGTTGLPIGGECSTNASLSRRPPRTCSQTSFAGPPRTVSARIRQGSVSVRVALSFMAHGVSPVIAKHDPISVQCSLICFVPRRLPAPAAGQRWVERGGLKHFACHKGRVPAAAESAAAALARPADSARAGGRLLWRTGFRSRPPRRRGGGPRRGHSDRFDAGPYRTW